MKASRKQEGLPIDASPRVRIRLAAGRIALPTVYHSALSEFPPQRLGKLFCLAPRQMTHKLTIAVVAFLCAKTAADVVADPQFVGINAITLATTNMTASWHFYGKLGLNCTYGCEPDANWTTFGTQDFVPNSFHINLYPAAPSLDSSALGGRAEFAPRQGWGRVIIYVHSVDDVYAFAVAKGLKAEFPPKNADWGERYFQILDPSGHELAIAKPLRTPAAAYSHSLAPL